MQEPDGQTCQNKISDEPERRILITSTGISGSFMFFTGIQLIQANFFGRVN